MRRSTERALWQMAGFYLAVLAVAALFYAYWYIVLPLLAVAVGTVVFYRRRPRPRKQVPR
jgi:hypothetical protein